MAHQKRNILRGGSVTVLVVAAILLATLPSTFAWYTAQTAASGAAIQFATMEPAAMAISESDVDYVFFCRVPVEPLAEGDKGPTEEPQYVEYEVTADKDAWEEAQSASDMEVELDYLIIPVEIATFGTASQGYFEVTVGDSTYYSQLISPDVPKENVVQFELKILTSKNDDRLPTVSGNALVWGNREILTVEACWGTPPAGPTLPSMIIYSAS